jgi:outer membrane protein OmpA-like peptidoglycan-associated protein
MTPLSAKTAALAVAIAMGSLMSTSAHAAILHTAAGTPVLTKDGSAVLTGVEGAYACDAEAQARAAELAAQAERVVFFDFNKSELTKQYKQQLRRLAKRLHTNPGKTITIVGFADRMGDAAYNEKLALKRAKTVRDFLVGVGIKAKKIEVRSLGKSVPKAECPVGLPRPEMISCLGVDRRVEIEVK